MCDACVIEQVKAQALSRRALFRGAGAAGIAAAAAGVAGAPARAQSAPSVTDLTHELTEDFPTFFGAQQFFMDKKFDAAKDGFNLYELRVSEHTGTHMDAPLHFSADGLSVAEIPVANLVTPLCVIDIRAKADADPDAQVTPDDIAAWVAANGPIPDNACVAMLSGWQSRLGSDGFRNADAGGVMHFPGFHIEATEKLLEETSAAGIAVDTLSLDFGASPDFATHRAWLPAGRWGIEAIANLDRVPVAGATLVVGAPKHRGGTGGPARILALG
ncbi:cyclase family protein [Amaricoccus sp.]|uniref:cyclase family protein n=1 Tax=Amaricoccus sp. TaxID=1872485 RepID=UPI001B4C69D1|nr:cyclase family protein [Amaricoccus sp.]MBP7003311.1 cyclase family protein [Amaricoccus sp.]